ncbi:uncharacterized protein TNCV_3130671 [Trichonephila clavipes]|nr:uncharacterized protein TNCV_3130671 [Trichonephila clavipes]
MDSTWFHSTSVQFPRAWNHSKRRRKWVDVKGSTRIGHHDPKRHSAKRIRIVREDTGATSEGDTLAWMAANEAVGCRRSFLTMRWFFSMTGL